MSLGLRISQMIQALITRNLLQSMRSIRNHAVEVIGKELRESMTAMKKSCKVGEALRHTKHSKGKGYRS